MTSRVMAFLAQEARLGDMEEVSRLVRTADGAHTTGGSRAAPAPHRLLDRGAAGVFLIAASYAAGIVVLRSAAFYAGLIATLVLAAQVPLLG
jgi:hypothetical protein